MSRLMFAACFALLGSADPGGGGCDNWPSKSAATAEEGSGSGSSGGCPDNGESCSSDSMVVAYTDQCASNPNAQAPCYCAAAYTYQCFLDHGCYAEAGAATQVTESELTQGRDDNNSNACSLGGCCF